MMTRVEKTSEGKINWRVLPLLLSAYIATNINLQGFLALLPFVQAELGLSKAQAGLYSTAFFSGTILLGIYTGRAVDVAGSRKGILFGILSMSLLLPAHSLIGGLPGLLLLSFLTGVCFSIVAPAVNKRVIEVISPRQRAFSMGFIQSGVGIGGFLGAVLLPFLGNLYGWRAAVLFPAALSLLLALIIGRGLTGAGSGASSRKVLPVWKALALLLRQRSLLYLYSFCLLLGSLQSFVITHFILFLNYDLGISSTTAGFCLGAAQVGGLVGQPLWGWFDERYFNGDRKKGILTLGILSALSSLFFAFNYSLSLPTWSLFPAAFILGFSGLGWMGLLFATVGEGAGETETGTAFGLALFFMRLGVVLSPSLLGYVSDVYESYRISWYLLGLAVLGLTAAYYLKSDCLKSDI